MPTVERNRDELRGTQGDDAAAARAPVPWVHERLKRRDPDLALKLTREYAHYAFSYCLPAYPRAIEEAVEQLMRRLDGSPRVRGLLEFKAPCEQVGRILEWIVWSRVTQLRNDLRDMPEEERSRFPYPGVPTKRLKTEERELRRAAELVADDEQTQRALIRRASNRAWERLFRHVDRQKLKIGHRSRSPITVLGEGVDALHGGDSQRERNHIIADLAREVLELEVDPEYVRQLMKRHRHSARDKA